MDQRQQTLAGGAPPLAVRFDRMGSVQLRPDVAREVAHGVQRTAAPVTTYLLGLAVGRGATTTEAAAAVRKALAEL